MLNRTIKKIYPTDGVIENNQTLTFTDILKIPNIVLLGEPGAGKSYLFDHASQYENGNCISARKFTIYADEFYSNKPVYIDALDEKRSRSEQPDSIGEIIRHIKQIKPSKVRLSCRVADWLGETDLELFKPYFEASEGPKKRQKSRDRQCLRLPQPSSLPSFHPDKGLKLWYANDSTRCRKACIFTTQTALRENTCTIASGDYSTPVSQRLF